MKKYWWVDKFESGEYVSRYNGYSPFYIGNFYGYNVTLGGEKEFRHCAGAFSGIADVEWWDNEHLSVLTDEQKIRLTDILHRNKCIDEYIKSHFCKLEYFFGEQTTTELHRQSNLSKLYVLWFSETIHKIDELVDYCIDNNIKELNVSGMFNELCKKIDDKKIKIKLEKDEEEFRKLDREEDENIFTEKLLNSIIGEPK